VKRWWYYLSSESRRVLVREGLSIGGAMVSISSHMVRLNSEQATSLIVERARQLVNQLIEHRGHDNPPFLPEEFARLLGCQVVRAELGETSGLLLKFHDGFVIKVNRNHGLARQNFSCAHEIGHVIFSELQLQRYIKSIEYRNRTFNPEGERGARARAIERLCDVAAAELLMPEEVFRKYLSGFGVSAHAIERLANIFRVSIRAVVRRIAELSIEPCIALFWQPDARSKNNALRLIWRVGPGRQDRGKTNYTPVHARIKCPSSLHRAYEHDGTVKSFKKFNVDNIVRRVPVESKGFGMGKNRYVVSLAFVSQGR
jgi:Zn-dependent peptidase ImmA (M78 family)